LREASSQNLLYTSWREGVHMFDDMDIDFEKVIQWRFSSAEPPAWLTLPSDRASARSPAFATCRSPVEVAEPVRECEDCSNRPVHACATLRHCHGKEYRTSVL